MLEWEDVRALGWDYYRRLVVNITLTEDADDGSYIITSAPGRLESWQKPTITFASAGIQGFLGHQRAHQRRELYEVLDVAEPHFLDSYITIGVKRVDSIGQESKYTLGELLMPAT
jgi:hypothetical protein